MAATRPSGLSARRGGSGALAPDLATAPDLSTPETASPRTPSPRDYDGAAGWVPAAPPRPRVRPLRPEGGASGGVRSINGQVRSGRRTKVLVRHLRRGEIALVDHEGIDRVSAEELISAGAAAVLNCRRSASDSYPNLGPQLLVEAGIPLIDLPDDSLFELLSDGDGIAVLVEQPPEQLTVRAFADGPRGPLRAEVLSGGNLVACGEVLDLARVCAETEVRRRELGEALERFARNTIEHMREERELLAGRIDLPRFRTDFRDRPALVVVRGVGHQRDLRALRPFIRDMRPVIVAVDGGAEALLEEGVTPDMIVGDMDSAGEHALRCGAELVVHSYHDGRAPGRERLEALGLDFELVPAPGTSQDVALLIPAEKGARLIVSVGSQFNLVEFLDRNRRGMSSTFLTRLRVGEILVDAKGVSRLYRPRPSLAPLLVVIAAGLIALLAVIGLTPALRDVVELLWLKLQLLLGWGR